jgi:tRNA dimethylallyltransferase
VVSKTPLIVIAGPTASGKSDIAVQLAKRIDGYIVNGDSRQVYKEMRIGTAQPVPEKTEGYVWYIDGVKHFLYGYKDITDTLNISMYQKDVQNILDSQKGIPILTGGTGLYIDSIVFNYNIDKEKIDKERRKELSLLNVNELQRAVDPNILSSLNESDRKNPRRLIRLIEGKKKTKENHPLNNKYFVLDIPKEELNNRIIQRVEKMFNDGLEEEVSELFKKYDSNLSSFNTIGYQEFREYFKVNITLEKVKEDIITHTLQYAKRQRTWFRRNKDAVWTNNFEDILQEAEQFIEIL